jgi:hypothetical protein
MADTEDTAEKRLDTATKKKVAKPAPAAKKATAPAATKVKGKEKGKKPNTKKNATEKIATEQVSRSSVVVLESTETEANGTDDSKGKSNNEEQVLHLDGEDERWESDLNINVILNKEINKDPYLTACKAIDIVPSSYISKNLQSTKIIMPYHGIGPNGARALGKVLEVPQS